MMIIMMMMMMMMTTIIIIMFRYNIYKQYKKTSGSTPSKTLNHKHRPKTGLQASINRQLRPADFSFLGSGIPHVASKIKWLGLA
jgi:hypothetical protein